MRTHAGEKEQCGGRCPRGKDGQGPLLAPAVRGEAWTESASEPVEGTDPAGTVMEDRQPLIVREEISVSKLLVYGNLFWQPREMNVSPARVRLCCSLSRTRDRMASGPHATSGCLWFSSHRTF